MRRSLLGLLLLGMFSLALGQQPSDLPAEIQGKVALAVNTGGHSTPLKGLAFTPDGKKQITAEHNEVHVWNVASGERERTWRLPKALERIAVSADGKTVAAAGWGQAARTTIWLLDIPTGSARVHQPPLFAVHALAFSPDGQRLAWGTPEQAGVLEVKAGRITHTTPKTANVTTVVFSKDGSQLLVAGGAGKKADQLQVWDVKPAGKAKTPIQLEKPLFSLEKSEVPQVAWAPDGSRFASWQKAEKGLEVVLWTADGKRERTIAVPGLTEANLLQFTSADRLAVVATEQARAKACLVDVKTGKVDAIRGGPFQRPEWLHTACSSDGKLVAYASGPGFQVRLLDLAEKQPVRLVGQPHPIPHFVGWKADNRSIAWGFDWDAKKPLASALVRGLNLATLEPLSGTQLKGFQPGRQKPDGWDTKYETKENRSDKKAGYTLIHNGKRIETEVHQSLRTWTFYKDGQGKPRMVMALGGGGIVLVDAETGKIVATVVGHVRAHMVAVSPDGRFLLMASGQQALDLYRIDQKPVLLLSILAAGEDWIAWTPQGYYDATPGGERLMGWSIKKDDISPLTFYPIERFRKQFHRPDIIKLVLEKGSVEEALKAVDARPVEVEKLLPPRCSLTIVDQKDLPRIKVKAVAEAAVKQQPVVALRLLVDGRPWPGAQKELKAGEKPEAEWTLELPPGKHELKVLARGPDTAAVSEVIELFAPLPDKDRPAVYLLPIGIDTYQDPALKLNFAAADARAIAAAFKQSCAGPGNLFREAKGEPLVNEKATRKGILDALAAARKQVKPNDLVVVFFAGHGVKEKDQFYLLPVDADMKSLAKTALSGDDLRKGLGEFPCQVLLMLDACHSAGIKGFKPAVDELTRTLTEDEVGVVVMCAAMAHEKALERKGNGLFTKAVVAGLSESQGVPHNPFNRRQYIHHLHAYVFDRVSAESEDRQHPFLSLPWVVESFALRQLPMKSPGER